MDVMTKHYRPQLASISTQHSLSVHSSLATKPCCSRGAPSIRMSPASGRIMAWRTTRPQLASCQAQVPTRCGEDIPWAPLLTPFHTLASKVRTDRCDERQATTPQNLLKRGSQKALESLSEASDLQLSSICHCILHGAHGALLLEVLRKANARLLLA